MSLSPSDWDLLHRVVDGEATEAESAELEKRLAREPELAQGHQALLGVGQTLSQVGLVEPPPELGRDVMRQVRLRSRSQERGWLSGLTAWVIRRPALALASSLAVGLLAGLLVTGLSGRGAFAPLEEGAVSGTLLPPAHLAALPVVDEARLEGPGFRVSAVTRRGPEVVVAELEIAAEGTVDVVFEVDASALRPRGFECLGGEAAGGVVIEPGRVEVSRAPPGRCFVSLAVLGASPGPLTVRLLAGTERAEATLEAPAAAQKIEPSPAADVEEEKEIEP
jgi:hypothetical protein